MKAVVMEVKNGCSVILTEEGIFEKVNKVYTVGDTIEWNAADKHPSYKSVSGRRAVRYLSTAASIALLVAAGSGVAYQTAFACSYVSVDVNPSIEFTLNRMNRVLSVEGLNEESQAIVDELNALHVRFDTLEDALQKTRNILEEKSYLPESSDPILIDIASDEPGRVVALSDAVERGLEPPSGESAKSLYLTTSTIEERNEARAHDLSAGRYDAMKRDAAENGEQIDEAAFDSFRTLPVEQLLPPQEDAPEDQPSGISPSPSGGRHEEQPAQSFDEQGQEPEMSSPEEQRQAPETPSLEEQRQAPETPSLEEQRQAPEMPKRLSDGQPQI